MASDLERAQATRRRLFQDVVHELKTPLAVIDATTIAVLDGVYDHDDRHLETIRDQSRLLARIVDDLRTIGLAEAGDLPLRREPIDVATLIGDTERAFAARAGEAGVSLSVGAADDLVVEADVDRLKQVLAALVDNAIRHTPRGGVVAIQAQATGSRVRIERPRHRPRHRGRGPAPSVRPLLPGRSRARPLDGVVRAGAGDRPGPRRGARWVGRRRQRRGGWGQVLDRAGSNDSRTARARRRRDHRIRAWLARTLTPHVRTDHREPGDRPPMVGRCTGGTG